MAARDMDAVKYLDEHSLIFNGLQQIVRSANMPQFIDPEIQQQCFNATNDRVIYTIGFTMTYDDANSEDGRKTRFIIINPLIKGEFERVIVNFNPKEQLPLYIEQLKLTCQTIKRFLSSKVNADVIINGCLEHRRKNSPEIQIINDEFQKEWAGKNLGIEGRSDFSINPSYSFINLRLKRTLVLNISPRLKFEIIQNRSYLDAAAAEMISDIKEGTS